MSEPIAAQLITPSAALPAPIPPVGQVIANDPMMQTEMIAALPLIPLPPNLGQNVDKQA